MNWLENITIEDLPEDYQAVAEVAGIECAIRFSERLGGGQYYFPKLEALVAKKKAEYIIKNFSGANHRELAQATGYTERWVYEILRCHRERRQCDLFPSPTPE